jgi:hypothetical protein
MMLQTLVLVTVLAASVAQSGPRLEPTVPAPPTNATEQLLRTALAHILSKPREGLSPDTTPVLIVRNSPLISGRILPERPRATFVLMSREELQALGDRQDAVRRYSMAVRILSQSDESAVVEVFVGPVVGKGQVALCCWTERSRYQRTSTGWTFDLVVSAGVV